MYNIFIEGTQGSGKSTLVTALQKHLPGYTAYREGDLSPTELAWCAYMTEAQYQEALETYDWAADEIRRNSLREGDMRIVSYTRVFAEVRAFYEYMESFEIYNGRVPYQKFREIIMQRYRAWSGSGNIFECSLFQNAIESMMLFYELSEEEILDFYREAYDILKEKDFFLIYLKVEDLRGAIEQIRRERTDHRGNGMWFPLMMNYLKSSPYGQHHGYQAFEDLIAHLERRVQIEQRIMKEIMEEKVLILPAKEYRMEDIVQKQMIG